MLLAIAIAGVIYQRIGSAADRRNFPPLGRLLDAGGHRLHAVVEGQGSPTVILEAGISASSLSWSLVQPEIANFARVLSYDRASLGWSDRSATSRTTCNLI